MTREITSFEIRRSFTPDSFVSTSQFRSKSLTVMFLSQFWISGLVREVISYVGSKQKKIEGQMKFIWMEKKMMLGYEMLNSHI